MPDTKPETKSNSTEKQEAANPETTPAKTVTTSPAQTTAKAKPVTAITDVGGAKSGKVYKAGATLPADDFIHGQRTLDNLVQSKVAKYS